MAKNLPVSSRIPPKGAGRPMGDVTPKILALEVGGAPATFDRERSERVRSLASYHARRLGRKFTTREIGTTISVWRIA